MYWIKSLEFMEGASGWGPLAKQQSHKCSIAAVEEDVSTTKWPQVNTTTGKEAAVEVEQCRLCSGGTHQRQPLGVYIQYTQCTWSLRYIRQYGTVALTPTHKACCSDYAMSGAVIQMRHINEQRQTGASDCGLFALAFATALCAGKDPHKCSFNQNRMKTTRS